MDNGASSYRRFLEGDESAFDEIMKELLAIVVTALLAAIFVGCLIRAKD